MSLKSRIKGWCRKMGEEDKKKKKKRELKECPYCKNHYGNVQNHIKLAHPTEAKESGREIEPVVSKDTLLGGKPPPTPPNPEDKIYYCTGCQAKLRKGENPCWNCGKNLNWEGK